ncbi:MAG TPA: hypothetical protein VFO05_08485 [Candidatus Limnocylindrales bacterium]|nr:hypothetical protein [Candidatus Limnocylindrales bacterium]
MKISLRQKGGVFGGDRTVDLSETELEVIESGQSVSKRILTEGETQRVDDVAKRLISNAPAQDASDPAYASDSLLTEVQIGDAEDQWTYRFRSGDAAPDELLELVGTLSEVAEAPPEEPVESGPTQGPGLRPS